MSFGEPDQPHLPAVGHEACGEVGEVRRRPPLRRAVLRAGTQHRHRRIGAQVHRAHRGAAIGDVGHEHRAGWCRHERPGRGRQRGEPVDEPRQALGVQPARVVQQAVAELAHVARAPWNAREIRHECRLPGVGQHDRAGVLHGHELARELAARHEVEATVREGRLDQPAHAAHAAEDRRAPRRREHVDDRILVGLAQERDQRLREDRVADPGRRDDQDALGGHGTCASKRDGPQCGPSSIKRGRRGRRLRAGTRCCSRGTVPCRSSRRRGRPAGGSSTAASPGWGRTPGRSPGSTTTGGGVARPWPIVTPGTPSSTGPDCAR